MKWICTTYGKQLIAKDKVEHLTTFEPHDPTAKTECAEDLESFLAQTIQEQGALNMGNVRKWHDRTAVVKVKPTM